MSEQGRAARHGGAITRSTIWVAVALVFALAVGGWVLSRVVGGGDDDSATGTGGDGNAATGPARTGDGDAATTHPGDAGADSTSEQAVAVDDPADLALLQQANGPAARDERFYFVLPDRFANGDEANDTGGIEGDRNAHGFDPTDEGFFHGGDLAGLQQQLDYLDGLGVTALWLTPVMTNKAVQGDQGQESAGYHGYWVTDFTSVDPHLGSEAELTALIEAAHERDMKVYLDIITNHTADVIGYQEGQTSYRPTDQEPYTPVVPEAEADLKVPDWLNDTDNYNNRGNSTFEGESSLLGDFHGLDDLDTTRPEVVEGMIDVYTGWIDLGIDGFRIDTVKHVDIEFWQQWAPAVLEHAEQVGNDDFFMFGEVYDSNPRVMSEYVTVGGLPATLDFGFQAAATDYAAGGSASGLSGLYEGDDWYTSDASDASVLPTFLGNHDMGRFAHFLGSATLGRDDLIERVELGHSLMFLTRGQPVVYYGDEQGLIGLGGDKAARQSLFATQVERYARQDLVTGQPSDVDLYDTDAPIYRHIAELAALREDHPALASGRQITRYASDGPGIFAVSRIGDDGSEAAEYLVAVNNDVEQATATVPTGTPDAPFTVVWSSQDEQPEVPVSGSDGAAEVTLAPLSATVFVAPGGGLPAVTEPLGLQVVAAELTGRPEISAEVDASGPLEPVVDVTFAARPVGTQQWQILGTDTAPPYRVFPDVSGWEEGQWEIRAVAAPLDGPVSGSSTLAEVSAAAEPPAAGQPTSVTVPGTANVEMGCGAQWVPDCPGAALEWDAASETWVGEWDLPAGNYEFKIAIDGAWEENYGVDGELDGENLVVEHPGGPWRIGYDHGTHQVTLP